MTQGAEPLWHPSPNFGARRNGARPDLIVLHYTAMATAQEALERLCDPEHEVSAHYLIAPRGQIWQMVREEDRAWHAGAGSWQGRGDVNSRSIGIELANTGQQPFAAPQMDALEKLMGAIMGRWSIGPEGVIGHSDMAPLRKADPGRRFDWHRLAQTGLAVWPQAGGAGCKIQPDAKRFAEHARRFGYPDVPDPALLDAFRQRFRPWVQTASLEAQDMAVITDLAARFGVDPANGNA